MTASSPPPIVVVVAAVGGGIVDGGVVDQAVAKDAMDPEAAASFVVGHCGPGRCEGGVDVEASFVVSIIIISPTPPKIIAPPLERLVTTASPEPSSSPHCLLTDGGRIRVGGL